MNDAWIDKLLDMGREADVACWAAVGSTDILFWTDSGQGYGWRGGSGYGVGYRIHEIARAGRLPIDFLATESGNGFGHGYGWTGCESFDVHSSDFQLYGPCPPDQPWIT